MTGKLIDSYAVGGIRRGKAASKGVLTGLGFQAMIAHEVGLEIDVPPLENHVLVVALNDRNELWSNLGGGRRRVRYPKGSSVFIPSGCPAWFASPGCASDVLHVHFKQDVILATLSGLAPERFDIPILARRDPLIAELCEQLSTVIRAGAPPPALYSESLFTVMAAQLGKLQQSPGSVANCGGLSPRTLKRVQTYLMEHSDRDVSLQDLASLADLSPYHLCRAFKKSTGLPPHAWLMVRRMERAQNMITAHPKMGLTEIALCVGYSSQAAFCAAFKRATGSTPSRWRRDSAS